MKKAEFIETLAQRLAPMSASERRKALDYYSEMIDDRMEEGTSEEEAVRALGDLEALARAAAQETGANSLPEESCRSGMTFSEPIRAVIIDCEDLDFSIIPGALPDGVSARLDCPPGKAEQLSCTFSDGTLAIRRLSPAKRLPLRIRFAFQKPYLLTVNDAALERLQMHSTLGDLDAQGLRISESLTVNSRSGDVQIVHTQILGTASIQNKYGDLVLREVSSEDALKADTISGDMTLERVQANHLEIHTTSGDIEVHGAKAPFFHSESTSGDQELTQLEAEELLTLRTVSGDLNLIGSEAGSLELCATSGDVKLEQSSILTDARLQLTSGDVTLKRVSAGQFDISTSNGDVSGILSGGMDVYDFRAVTRCGDIQVPVTRGPRVVNVATSSGDIRLRAE